MVKTVNYLEKMSRVTSLDIHWEIVFPWQQQHVLAMLSAAGNTCPCIDGFLK